MSAVPNTVPQNPEESLIKVAGKSNPKEVAVTISAALMEGRTPKIRTIGAGSLNQAMKSIIVASAYAALRGQTLVVRPSWETVPAVKHVRGESMAPDETNVSAMVLRVIASTGL